VKTYLVFEPEEGGRNADTADRILFVREKFVWTALIFAPFWLLWHQLWLGLFGWIAAVTSIGFIGWWFSLDQAMTPLAVFLPSLLVAFEVGELRRHKFLRNGYRDAGVAVGSDLEDAEQRFFARWVALEKAPRPQPQPPAPEMLLPPMREAPIIGLFPQPGASR
jgi:hypothetical protein